MNGWGSRAALLVVGALAAAVGAVAPVGPAAGGVESSTTPQASESPEARVLFRLQDRAITESSGLVDGGDVVHTVNDSGSGPELFTVDVESGETAYVTRYSAGEVEDVEALAPAGGGAVWVADIGDNAARRDTVWVYRVRPGSSAPAPRFGFRYPGGPRDAETLLAHPETGRLFVVSKTVFGGQVYAAPRRLTPGTVHRLRPWARVGGLLTDGAFLPDGRHVLLRDYAAATLYSFPDFGVVGSLPLPTQEQGEGLAVGEDGRVLLSSEGVGEAVLEIDVPRRLLDRAPSTASPEPEAGSTAPGEVEPVPGGTASKAAPEEPGDAVPERGLPWEWWSAGLAAGAALVALAVHVARRRGRRDGW